MSFRGGKQSESKQNNGYIQLNQDETQITAVVDFLSKKWENPPVMRTKDTIPFLRGFKGEHIVCKAKLEKMGIMATCCVCDPHYDCEAVKKNIFLRRRQPNFIDRAIANIEKKVVGKTDEDVQLVIDSLIEEEWIMQQGKWVQNSEREETEQSYGQQKVWLDKLRYFIT